MKRLARFNPFRCTGTALPPHVLLMVKMIIVGLLVLREVIWLPERYLPFLSVFDLVSNPAPLKLVLQIALMAGCTLVLFNVAPRIGCVAIAASILLSILSAREYFTNNLVYISLLMIMAALQTKGGGATERLIPSQIAIVYFGAGLNKLLEADWRSGIFFDNWIKVIDLPMLSAAAAALPPLMLGKLAGWMGLCTELFLGVAFTIPRLWRAAVWAGVCLHVGLMLLTHSIYGYFVIAAFSAYLALFKWSAEPLLVRFDPSSLFGRFARVFRAIDFDGRLMLEPTPGAALTVTAGAEERRGMVAVRTVMAHLPLLPMLAIAVFAMLGNDYPPPLPHTVMTITLNVLVVALLFLLSPPFERLMNRWGAAPRPAAAAAPP